MRIHLSTSASNQLHSYNYQHRLTGAIHKWLGPDNPYHGQPALFSFSALSGGKSVDNRGLKFPSGSQWFISAHDAEFLKTIIRGIQQDPLIMEDIHVTEITIADDPVFSPTQIFRVGSPVLVKRQMPDGRTNHRLFSDTDSDHILTESLQKKLQIAHLPTEGIQVAFVRDQPGARTKLIQYDRISNRANYCPVAITGSPEQLTFAWNVGIGHSTGVGFGSLV
jgi:CRISPR-associated endoribonuclease Cas6